MEGSLEARSVLALAAHFPDFEGLLREKGWDLGAVPVKRGSVRIRTGEWPAV